MSNSQITRRQFLQMALRLSAGAGLMMGGGGAYSALIEPHWLSIDRIDVWLPRLPLDLDGLTIAQLSDFHYSSYVSADEIRAAVDATNQLDPDVIALTGDYITRSISRVERCAQILGALRARSGVVAILGNHDHWTDAGLITRALESQSISVLRNAAIPIERGSSRLWLAGVDDVWERLADLDRALRRVPKDEVTILLAHEPDYADVVARYPIDLQLSGHSHGGQVRLPLIGAPVLPYLGRKYPLGLQRVGALQVYTNRGIGVVRPPVRFNCRPEVTLLTLRASRA